MNGNLKQFSAFSCAPPSLCQLFQKLDGFELINMCLIGYHHPTSNKREWIIAVTNCQLRESLLNFCQIFGQNFWFGRKLLNSAPFDKATSFLIRKKLGYSMKTCLWWTNQKARNLITEIDNLIRADSLSVGSQSESMCAHIQGQPIQ